MSSGAYSALTGMRVRLEELDRVAADLANVSTAGYKTERITTEEMRRAQFDAALGSATDVALGATKTDFRPGTIVATGRNLDVAIDGSGFFAIETPAGERYTRSGVFSKGTDALLVTVNGEPVLGESGQPIKLPNGPIAVGTDGTVRSGSVMVGKLRIVAVPEASLLRESGSRFRAAEGADVQEVDATLVVGAIEQSNVNLIERIAKLTELSRGFEALEKGMESLMNELDGRAIAELSKR